MRVKDLMTKEVFSLRDDKHVVVAQEIMSWAKVRHVPVVDADNRVVGLISHRDLLRVSLAAMDETTPVDQRQHLAKIPVGQLMATEVRCIDAEAPVQGAARLMRTGKFGCLPVVDHKGVLQGIITEHDLLRVVEMLAPPA